MAMIGIHDLHAAALDDADMVQAFALDPDALRDTAPGLGFARSTFEAVSVFAHADAVNLPGVRLVRL